MSSGSEPAASAAAGSDREPIAARLTSEQVWCALAGASFAVVSYVTPTGEPRSSGVVYATAGRRLYVAVASDSWKARHIAASGRVANRLVQEMTFLNGVVLEPEQQLALIEPVRRYRRPGRRSHGTAFRGGVGPRRQHPVPVGKQMSSHLGGTRNAMVVAWPGRIKAGREVRTQFTHCIDIGPTVLDAVGLPEPRVVDGIGGCSWPTPTSSAGSGCGSTVTGS